MAATQGFGIDVGGSGIKGCLVDLDAGQLATDRIRLATPQPSTPEAVADAAAEIVAKFGWTGPIGITLPLVIKEGVAHTAANVDKSWIGTDARSLFADRLGREPAELTLLNDADAAGIAEIQYGPERARKGVTALLTFGTGIGSALFHDGVLLPNTEFGHLEVEGHDAETRAAASVKDEEDLTWENWSKRVSTYLRALESVLWPDLIIAGGGVSKKAEKWLPLLDVRTDVIAASRQNAAGIIGAAVAASSKIRH
ncbi:polyphosphate glucokinase [Tamaricihabitans halophyticus]|uniref:Polyphosphate glucokinase n=1 Tax=Tamaricihabitans halophyticus TaxID=1262583 RepID=A0A4R2R749_9PSEU|nr:ROK family protein [Tamaricihabitans halophyticus]TCP55215.1 polyphosphate glucokinase [Tamaricihabitans halophyticus]